MKPQAVYLYKSPVIYIIANYFILSAFLLEHILEDLFLPSSAFTSSDSLDA